MRRIFYLFPFLFTFSQGNWDTLCLFSSPPYRLGKVSTFRQLKGILDETTRIFLCDQDTGFVYLLTDTASFYPPKFRIENLGRIGGGYLAMGSGDLDGDGKNDLILGQRRSPSTVQRFYWANGWQREEIANFNEAIYDLVIGDADNDGREEIILGCQSNLRLIRYRVSDWDTITILRNTGAIKGITIGDFDPTSFGKEIGITLPNGKVKRVYWRGNFWDTLTIFDNSSMELAELVSGDFDAFSPGEEICISNTRSPQSLGSLIEVFYDYGWNSRVIYRPGIENFRYADLTVGDFYDGSLGKEILAINEFGTDNHCRMVYGRGNDWQSSVIFSVGTTRAFYGIFVGEANRHRSYNDEILATAGGLLYLIQQYSIPPPVITNISQPLFPLPGESLNIRAKIWTDYDSLNYIFDTLYLSSDGISFYPKLKDSFRFRDSLFFYSLPPGDSGARYFYYLRAYNRAGLFTQSPDRVLTLSYPRRIYEIQYTTDTSGISPDTNKWVVTTGIVSGVFGSDFFMEDLEFSLFRGIYVNSPYSVSVGDSLKISGRVREVNKLTTIRVIPDSSSSLLILRQGLSLSPPTIRINQVGESHEGVLVKIDTLHFKVRGFFAPNQGYWAYDFNERESILVWIDSRTDLSGMEIPETNFLLTGNISQVGNNFQIWPRARNDFLIYPPGIEELKKTQTKEMGVGREWEIFDALGRKVKGSRLATGVYILRSGKKSKVVLINHLRKICVPGNN